MAIVVLLAACDLKDEDQRCVLANYFVVANTSEDDLETLLDSRQQAEGVPVINTTRVIPRVTKPFTVKEGLLSLENEQAKGLQRLRNEFKTNEGMLIAMAHDDFESTENQPAKKLFVRHHNAQLADKAAKLLETPHANKRQNFIRSAHVGDLQGSLPQMAAELEAKRQMTEALQHVQQSKVNSEVV
jgi:hypothetical protein